MRKTAIYIALSIALLACSYQPNKPTLSDLGSRHWQGTYYLSVKGTPTSIKCSADPRYQRIDDIPVTYEGEDAFVLFDLSSDQRKMAALREQCLAKSIQMRSVNK